MTFAGNTLPVKSRPPTYQRRISRTRIRDERPREQPQPWEWAPEREVVVGRTGRSLSEETKQKMRESNRLYWERVGDEGLRKHIETITAAKRGVVSVGNY